MAYDDRDDDLDIRKPRSSGGGGDGGDVPNYLVQSILVTLCCCLPFGIAAIVSAAKVNSLLASGDYEGAVKASEEAKKWCWVSFILGIIGVPISIALQIMAGQGR